MNKVKGPSSYGVLPGPNDGDLDLYFEFFFGAHRPPLMHADRGWHPAADLYETADSLVIRVDIAGIEIEDISLVLDKQTLKLTGCRREPSGEEKRQYHKMEVPYGPFERIFRLPSPVCADETRAEYKAGFLLIEMKKRDKPLARKTTIKIR